MSNIKLMNCGFSTKLGKNNNNTEIDVEIMALKPGIYHDMNGTEVEITSKTIHSICDVYNEAVKKQYEEDKILTPDIEKAGIEYFDNRQAPNQLDHDDGTVLKTVGNVIGFMHVEDVEDVPHLFMGVRVKGEENVLPVKDKRRRNVSVQYNPETHEFIEISWVVKGAAPSARSLLSKSIEKSTINDNKSTTFKLQLDKMRENEQILLLKREKIEQQLAVKKYLIALCVNGKINRATADFVEHKIESNNINNPLEVIKLMESILPNEKFKPRYFKLKEKEEEAMSQSNTPLTTHDFLANITLGKEKEKLSKKIDEDEGEHRAELKNYSKEHSLKHKELTDKMAEAYEKGDVEMAKKYKEKANKLSEDCADGTANLSEYDVEKDSEKSDDVKKMSAQIAEITLSLAKSQNEQTVALNKFKDDQMAVLSSFADKITENFNSSTASVVLAEIKKFQESQGVK